jgi:hypothetical protein
MPPGLIIDCGKFSRKIRAEAAEAKNNFVDVINDYTDKVAERNHATRGVHRGLA